MKDMAHRLGSAELIEGGSSTGSPKISISQAWDVQGELRSSTKVTSGVMIRNLLSRWETSSPSHQKNFQGMISDNEFLHVSA